MKYRELCNDLIFQEDRNLRFIWKSCSALVLGDINCKFFVAFGFKMNAVGKTQIQKIRVYSVSHFVRLLTCVVFVF